MNSRKLLKKLKLFMSVEQREQIAQRDTLKKLLKKLRKKRNLLNEALENAGSKSERQRILEEMQILTVHRQKGLALLQQLQSKYPTEQIKAEPESTPAHRGVDGPVAKAPTLELIPSRRKRPADPGLALRERASHWPWRVA
jgi:hypothetical protein